MSSLETIENSAKIRNLCVGVAQYFVANIRTDSITGKTYLFDSELSSKASDCSTVQVASFLSFWGRNLKDSAIEQIGHKLFLDVNFSDPFRGVYNVIINNQGIFDLAEAGAGLSNIDLIDKSIVKLRADSIINFVESRVLGSISSERKGAFYKNINAVSFDVLNGNIYAILVIAKIQKSLGISSYNDYIISTVEHIMSRFNRSERLGWPYSESWNGEPKVGYSLSYQATIIAWGALFNDFLPSQLASSWNRMLWAALQRVIIGLESGDSESNEATTWSRNWENTWEIDLSLSRWTSDYCSLRVLNRLHELADEFVLKDILVFADTRSQSPGRTIMGSTMRKASNFASVYSSMVSSPPMTPMLNS